MQSGLRSPEVAGASWSIAGPRRILAIALLCAGVVGLLTIPRVAQATSDYDGDNDGLIAVASPAQLNAIRWDLDGDGAADDTANQASYAAAFPNAAAGMGCPSNHCTGYELTANLDFSGTGWASGQGWDPLGEFSGAPDTSFTATFDGNDHTISNLYVNRTGESYLGLFADVGASAEIRSVRLLGGTVTGHSNVGGLVGRNAGTIRGSYATVAIQVHDGTGGGLVGRNSGTIYASYATGTVTSYSSVGGLVGSSRGTIDNSYAIGNVSGIAMVGGLVGYTSGPQLPDSPGVIRYSHATGSVAHNQGMTPDPNAFGGLVGYFGGLVGFNYGQISASYATGNLSGAFEYAGGLVGWNSANGGTAGWGLIRASYARGNVTGTGRSRVVGGLAGVNTNGARAPVSAPATPRAKSRLRASRLTIWADTALSERAAWSDITKRPKGPKVIRPTKSPRSATATGIPRPPAW